MQYNFFLLPTQPPSKGMSSSSSIETHAPPIDRLPPTGGVCREFGSTRGRRNYPHFGELGRSPLDSHVAPSGGGGCGVHNGSPGFFSGPGGAWVPNLATRSGGHVGLRFRSFNPSNVGGGGV